MIHPVPAAARISRRWCAAAGTGVVVSAGALALALALAVTTDRAAAAAPACGSTGVLTGSDRLVCTYSTVGSDTFTVPAGVARLDLSVVGAAGGNYFIDGNADHPDPSGALTGRSGGAGGEVAATLNLAAGQVIEIDVAGRGANGTAASRSGGMQNGPSGGTGALGGFGGSDGGVAGGPGDASGANGGSAPFDGGNGSGGGGSSDVRVDTQGCAALTCGLSDRVLVAGGGGGGGGTGGQGNAIGAFGGVGGASNTGCPRTTANDPANNPGFGCGGFPDGGNRGTSGFASTAGGGGTPGLNPGRHATGANPNDPRYGGDGSPGASGSGGAGGSGNRPCTDPSLGGVCNAGAKTSGGGAGGGGGGGFYGGGGASGGGGTFGGGGGAGGGGGGGSSFAAANASQVTLTPDANCDPTAKASCSPTVNNGNGQVTVSWTSLTSPALALSLTAPGNAVAGQQSSATANLAGGSRPTGTITFRLYGPGDTSCQTPLASSTAPVTGDGSYSSTAVTVTGVGTYRWVAGYGGDSANPARDVPCAGGAPVTVTAAAPTGGGPGNSTAPATSPGGGSGGGGARGGGNGGPGGAGGRGNGGTGTGAGTPLAGTGVKPHTGGVHRHAPARRTTGAGPGAGASSTPTTPAATRATGSPASGPGAGSRHASSSGGATGAHAPAVARRFGVLIDAPTAGLGLSGAKPAKSPLSALALASDSSGAAGAVGGSIGWVGGGVLLFLLVVGVLVEIGPPRRRRQGTGIA